MAQEEVHLQDLQAVFLQLAVQEVFLQLAVQEVFLQLAVLGHILEEFLHQQEERIPHHL